MNTIVEMNQVALRAFDIWELQWFLDGTHDLPAGAKTILWGISRCVIEDEIERRTMERIG